MHFNKIFFWSKKTINLISNIIYHDFSVKIQIYICIHIKCRICMRCKRAIIFLRTSKPCRDSHDKMSNHINIAHLPFHTRRSPMRNVVIVKLPTFVIFPQQRAVLLSWPAILSWPLILVIFLSRHPFLPICHPR